MSDDDNDGQMIFGELGGLKIPDICLTGEEKPRKTSPRKLVLTGDQIWAHCMTGVHATTCPTAVDHSGGQFQKWKIKFSFMDLKTELNGVAQFTKTTRKLQLKKYKTL